MFIIIFGDSDCTEAVVAMLHNMGVAKTELFSDYKAFSNYLHGHLYDTVLLLEKGPRSTETASEIRSLGHRGTFVWFSDLDFSLLAFRLRADYFGLFPINREKLEAAIYSIKENK